MVVRVQSAGDAAAALIVSQVTRSSDEILDALPKYPLRRWATGGYTPGADHTAILQAAAADQVAARNGGNPFAIYAEGLQWRFNLGTNTRLDWGGPLIGEGPQNTEFLNTNNSRTPSGGTEGGNFRWTGASTLAIIRGLTIRGANIPAVADMFNDPNEFDAAIITDFASNVMVENVWVRDYYGVPVLVRRANKFLVRNCRIRGTEKDGISVSHGCADGVINGNEVYYGGDDMFSILGPEGLIRPTRIYHIGNYGRGCKFARGLVYAGAENCYASGNVIDGNIPQYIDNVATGYPLNNGVGGRFLTLSGLMIIRDGTSGNQGNENIVVRGMRIIDCGFTSDFGSGNYDAVMINGTAGFPNIGIDIEVDVYGGRRRSLAISSNTSSITGNQDIRVRGSFSTNIDPSGLGGTANAGTQAAIVVDYATDVDIDAYIQESGGGGILNASASLDGRVRLKARTRTLSRAGTAGNVAIAMVTGQPSTDIGIDLDVQEQLQNTTSGTAYYLANLLNTPGLTGKVTEFGVASQNLTHGFTTGVTPTTITPTGSPQTFTNSTGAQVSVEIQGGTVTVIEVDLNDGNGLIQQYTALGVAAVNGNYKIPNGGALRITYSVAPTTFRYRSYSF
jgi:hypothetical protein